MAVITRSIACGGGALVPLLGVGLVAPEPDHARCPGSQVTPGVIGGWVCSCECHRAVPRALKENPNA